MTTDEDRLRGELLTLMARWLNGESVEYLAETPEAAEAVSWRVDGILFDLGLKDPANDMAYAVPSTATRTLQFVYKGHDFNIRVR